MIHKYKHLLYVLKSSEKEVQHIIKNIDSYYYYKKQPKKKSGINQEENGGIRYRELNPSIDNLKRIQERLNSFLQKIKIPNYAYGSIKGKNNILNALEHLDGNYFFSVDMKNFFPNISHHQVFRMFRYFDFSPSISHILTKLTTYRGSLPQGSPTSPIISNLVICRIRAILISFS